MTSALLVVVILLALSLTGLGATHLRYRRQPGKQLPAAGGRRILFPFIANALSPRALDASLRLARAEDAMRQTMDHERFDRIVIAAAARNNPGFGSEDIAWILENAPGEILVLRPDHEEVLTVPTKKLGTSSRRGRRPGARAVRARAAG